MSSTETETVEAEATEVTETTPEKPAKPARPSSSAPVTPRLKTRYHEEILRPERVRVDRARAWAALQRDKKRGLVLLGDDGPRWNVELPDDVVRAALDELIAT